MTKKTYFKKYKKPDPTRINNCEAIRGMSTADNNDLEFEPAWKLNKAPPRTYQRSKLQNKSCLRIENVVGNATKCYSVNEGNLPSPCSKKEKEYVFVFILNDENASHEKFDKNKFSNHCFNSDSLDLFDISSAMSDENITLGNVTVKNVLYSTANIKGLVCKIMDKMLLKNKIKTTNLADIAAEYFLALNHSIPVTTKNCSGSELSTSKEIDDVSTACIDPVCNSTDSSQSEMSPANLNSPVESNTQEKEENSGYLEIDIKFEKVKTKMKAGSKKGERNAKGKNTILLDNDVEISYELDAAGNCVCTKCNGIFKGLKTLQIHHRRHRCKGSETPYECGRCGTRFKTKQSRNKHIRTVCRLVSEKKKICEYCGKVCKDNSALWSHLLSHRNLRRYKCPECGKGFNKSSLLTLHIRNVHRKEKLWFYCARCGYKSLSRKHMLAHEQIHDLPEGAEIPTPFKCLCGKAYISQYKLTIHQNLTHKPKKCSICAEMLSSSYELLKHKEYSHGVVYAKSQKNNASQLCPVCGKKLMSIKSLNAHLAGIHKICHPGKGCTVECGKCLKSFHPFANFIIHRRKDHNEEVSESELRTMTESLMASASEMLSSSYELLKHKEYSHGVVYAKSQKNNASQLCPVCGKKLMSIKGLNTHLAAIHKICHPGKGCTVECGKCLKSFHPFANFIIHRRKDHNEEVSESELRTMTESLMASSPASASASASAVDNSGQKEWSCDRCDKKYKSKAHLAIHFSMTHKASVRTCPVCDMTFNSLRKYYMHKSSAHKLSEERTCRICHKLFPDKRRLWGHKPVHATTSFRCSDCGSRFKRKGDYARHMRDKHSVGKDAAGC